MVILIATIIILLILLFFCYIAYRFITPRRLVGKWSPEDLGHHYENFSVKTSDDIELRGWYIKGGEECIILLHGYGRSRWDEVYMKKMIEYLPKGGYSIITFDFRGHGESGGKHTTIGYREMRDLEAVYRWARRRHKKIYIMGFSMGANVALRAGVKGMGNKIVADSPFVDINATAKRAMNYFAGLPGFVYYFIRPFIMCFQRVNYNELNLMNFAEKISVPTLIIAGKKDKLVSTAEIREFFRVLHKFNPHAYLWVTEGEHVRSIILNRELYLKNVLKFLKGNQMQSNISQKDLIQVQ